MTAAIQVSLARQPDVDVVATLLAAQFLEHSIDVHAEALRAAIRGVLDQPARGAFLLAGGAEPVGLAYLAFIWTLEHAGPCAWLEELYVVPGARDRGVGTLLLREAMAHAAAQGCNAMDLEVEQEHARAEHLYRRAGFRPLRRSRWYAKL